MRLPLIAVSVALAGTAGAAGQEEPPQGFHALFNGENLDGWWGAGTEDPRDWQALDADALAAKKKASLDDIHQHWSVEDGVLVNDGQGLYLTTDQDYGDFELLLAVLGPRSNLFLLDADRRIVASLRPLAKTRPELSLGEAWRSPASRPPSEGEDRFADVPAAATSSSCASPRESRGSASSPWRSPLRPPPRSRRAPSTGASSTPPEASCPMPR